jgi:cytochrome c oxidase subunit 2
LHTLFILFNPGSVLANQPKDWQLGFQKSASKGMEDIVWFHDYMLLPVITAITVFVLFLIAYACIRFRASRNKEASTTSHNTTDRSSLDFNSLFNFNCFSCSII